MEDDRPLTKLWYLAISPVIWSIHFMVTYVSISIWCAKFGRNVGIRNWQWVFIGLTLLLSGIVLREIFIGYHAHREGNSEPPHDDDSPEDRSRFLGLARFLISSLSFVAIIYTAYVSLFFRSCQ